MRTTQLYSLRKAPTVPKQHIRNCLPGVPPRRTVGGKTSEHSSHHARRTGDQLLQLPATAAAFSLASALDLSHGARALPTINSKGWNSKRGVASKPRLGCPSKSAFSCRKRQRWVGRWVSLNVCRPEVTLKFACHGYSGQCRTEDYY